MWSPMTIAASGGGRRVPRAVVGVSLSQADPSGVEESVILALATSSTCSRIAAAAAAVRPVRSRSQATST